MSEWKNKVKKSVSDDYYCTGWNITDGFIEIFNLIKQKRKEKKPKKKNLID